MLQLDFAPLILNQRVVENQDRGTGRVDVGNGIFRGLHQIPGKDRRHLAMLVPFSIAFPWLYSMAEG